MTRRLSATIGVLALTLSSLAYAVPDACDAFGELAGSNPMESGDRVLFGTNKSDFFGKSMATGDFDGDGYLDLLVGASGSDVNGTNSGAAYLFYGPLSAGAALDANTADVTFGGAGAGDEAGWSVANAGDVDSDGVDDILIGAHNGRNLALARSGTAFLVLGGSLSAIEPLSTADAIFQGSAASDGFGSMVTGVGDVNGDGFDDVLVGAPTAEAGVLTDAGTAYLWYGPVSGPQLASSANVTFGSTQATSSFGTSSARVGDYDLDGYDDIVIGAPRMNSNGNNSGSVFAFYGGPSLPAVITTTAADKVLFGSTFGAVGTRAGTSIASAGDIDSDGYPDLVVGAAQYGSTKRGAAFIISSSTLYVSDSIALDVDYYTRVIGEDANDVAGSALATGDFDNDGNLDLLVGGERADAALLTTGAAWVVHGPFSDGDAILLNNPGSVRVGKIGGRESGDFTGSAVSAADLNDDGFADAIVGAYAARQSVGGKLSQGMVANYFGGEDINDLVAWYQDADGDGYGDAGTTTTACTAPSGYIADDDDCNDGSGAIHPYAVESCVGGIDANCDGFTGGTDHDGDGFAACNDCDDRTDLVSPAGVETCGDGVDNDCDQLIDDGTASDAQEWCPDADGDTYGDEVFCVAACEDPGIFLVSVVHVGGDCADSDPLRHPAAAEMCDLLDNNCDGSADDPTAVDATTWFSDSDGDTYGNFYSASRACSQPPGFVDNDQDCNDSNPLILPGAHETCDYVDNDCSGLHYIGGPVPASLARATMTGASNNAGLGRSMTFVPDLDGDGDDEFLVSASLQGGLASQAGAVYLVRGDIAGGALDFSATKADGSGYWNARFRSSKNSSFLGSSLGSGDINGDGETDLVIGGFGSRVPGTQQGAVYVFFGPIADGDYVVETDADFMAKGIAAGDQAGVSVAVGNLDNDIYDDLLIGAPAAAGGGVRRGDVYVVYGNGGMSGVQLSLSSASAVFRGLADSDQIGSSVAMVDLNADGFDDVVIGAERAGALDNGAAYVKYGSGTRFSGIVTGAAALTGMVSGDKVGLSVAGGGDINADGYQDLLIGSFNNKAYLVWGSASPVASAQINTAAAYYFDGQAGRTAERVAAAGDVDGDGFDDFLVSATGADEGATNAGGAFLVYGSDTWFAEVDSDGNKLISIDNIEGAGRIGVAPFPTFSASNRNWLEGGKLQGSAEGAAYGDSLAGGGDFNGDGALDVAVGAVGFDVSGASPNRGQAMIWAGGGYGIDNNDEVPLIEQSEYVWDFDADTHMDINDTRFTSCPMHAPISFRDPDSPVLRGALVSSGPVLDDCVDTDHTIYPGAPEVNDDGEDSNCDGFDNNNHPPDVSVHITPSAAYTSTSLTATVSVNDPDGDAVILGYQWFVNGAEIGGEITGVLGSTHFDKGDVVEVLVTADDGRGTYGPFDDSVTIRNSKPVLSSCNATPSVGTITTDFSVVGAGLADDDAEDAGLLTVAYQWQQKVGGFWFDITGETSTTLESCAERSTPGGINCTRNSRLRAICTPSDGSDEGLDYSSVEILIANSTPVITQCVLTPLAPDTDDNITVSASAIDGDGDSVSLTYQWVKNGVDIVGQVGSVLTGAEFVHFDVIQARCYASDGTGTSDPTASSPVTVVNTAPGAPVIDLTPNLPRSDQALAVAVVTPASDLDGDTITYDFYWTQNGTPFDNPSYPTSNQTLSASATVRGDQWEVTAIANDGYVPGGSDSDLVVIQNTPPTVVSAILSPAAPTTTSNITAAGVGFYDDDGDPENYNINWYVNGVLQPPQSPNKLVLDNTFIVRGDVVHATLQAMDPYATGNTVTTASLTVINQAPSAPSLAISPSAPGEDDNLTCNITTPSSDPDGDPITLAYAWYRDGSLVGGETSPTVSAALTSYAEVWHCTVTPNDGLINGDTGTSATVAIQDVGAPPAPILVGSAGRYTNALSSTLTGTCESGALDCNSITVTCVDATETDTYTGVACVADAFSSVVTLDNGETTTCTAKCIDSSGNQSLASNAKVSESCNPRDTFEDGGDYGDVGTNPIDEWSDVPDDNSVALTINANVVDGDAADWFRFTTTDNPVADAAAGANAYKFEVDMTVGTDDYNLWVRRSLSSATAECPVTGPYDDYTEDVTDLGDAPHHVQPVDRNKCAASGDANWSLYNECVSFAKDYYVEVLREFDTDCQHYQLKIYNGRP